MYKKNKSKVKWIILILVLLVTIFSVSMIIWGLYKEKTSEKNQEEQGTENEEELYEIDQSGALNAFNAETDEKDNINFALDALPDTVEPCGMSVIEDGLYITDSFSKCIWKVTDKTAEVYAGADSSRDIYDKPQGGYNDADASEALFKLPWGIAPFIGGIAVSDTDNNAIRIISDGHVDTLNSSDSNFSYNYPTGICTDESGNLYISDTHGNEIIIVFSDGSVNSFIDELESPMGLCWNDGYLYIAETGNNRIIRISTLDVSAPKSKNDIEVVAGNGEEGSNDADTLNSSFASPKGVAVAKDGTVYVADTINGCVRMVRNGEVITMAVLDKTNPDSELISPIGICIQGSKLYVGDNFGRKIFVVDR
ncbi:NHL domain-containing protein [Butyrivibrio sp. AE3004]|uniref:NHL domain-containing protein n=1 Tax=Butyrivibrio sp. AE3004 TaxID=1506994 RepID=UPI0004944454|nr:hypothetical protein [Butyrivibrio sp. AE3004]